MGTVSGYNQVLEIEGYAKGEGANLVWPYSEFEQVSQVEVCTGNTPGKVKKNKNIFIADEALYTSGFYSGYRKKRIVFDRPGYFKLRIVLHNVELMSLAGANLYGYLDPDSLELRFETGTDLALVYQAADTVGTGLKTAVLKGTTGNQYIFKKGRGLASALPEVRLMVLPQNRENDARAYFNQWLYRMAVDSLEPGPVLKKAADSLLGNITDERLIIQNVLGFVRKHITYIDIENKYRAFVPNTADHTYQVKTGDCKDMARLAYTLLRYKKLDAYLTLVSSVSHIYDLDFPCLASANHMICAVHCKNGDTVFVDATDPHVEFPYVSRHTQFRKGFIIDNNRGQYLTIHQPVSAVDQLEFTIDLTEETGNMKLDILVRGLYAADIVEILNLKKSKTESALKEYFNLRNFGCENMTYAYDPDSMKFSLQAQGQVSAQSLFSVGNKKMLKLNFIPYVLPAVQSCSEKDSLCALNSRTGLVYRMNLKNQSGIFPGTVFPEVFQAGILQIKQNKLAGSRNAEYYLSMYSPTNVLPAKEITNLNQYFQNLSGHILLLH